MTNDAGWRHLFRGGFGVFTVMLNLAVGLHALDSFIVSTVMPSVVRDIGGTRYYTWATMLYMVASIIGAASGGSMLARFGPRRALVTGGALFLAGSIGCAASPAMATLLVGRTVQGFADGLAVSISMSLVRELFPELLRKRILATFSITWGVAALVGPAIGGLFAQLVSWRGAFLMTTPIIAGFMLAAWLRLPKSPTSTLTHGFPFRRLAMLATGVVAVGVAGRWRDPPIQAGLIVLSFALVSATLRFDRVGGSRIFPTRPFGMRTTTGVGNWVMFLHSVTHIAIGIFLPLALQVLRGVDPLTAGYMTASLVAFWTLASVATSNLHGRAASAAIVVGQIFCCVGFGGVALGFDTAPIWAIPLLTGLLGLGLGSSDLHVVAAVMRHASKDEGSITASSIQTVRVLGIAFGAAGAGVIANTAGLSDALLPADVAHAVLWVFGLVTLAPVLTLLLAVRLVALIRKDRQAEPI